jgi:hypothetical protein
VPLMIPPPLSLALGIALPRQPSDRTLLSSRENEARKSQSHSIHTTRAAWQRHGMRTHTNAHERWCNHAPLASHDSNSAARAAAIRPDCPTIARTHEHQKEASLSCGNSRARSQLRRPRTNDAHMPSGPTCRSRGDHEWTKPFSCVDEVVCEGVCGLSLLLFDARRTRTRAGLWARSRPGLWMRS